MEYLGHALRHEKKYYINESMCRTLRERLRVAANPDPNMKAEEGYLVSSLYFDDLYGSAWNEKEAGIRFRKKYRIRSYNRNDQMIRLECKRKYGEYISKDSMRISRAEYDAVLRGAYDVLLDRSDVLGKELYALRHTVYIRPVTVVEYVREAYVLEQGNVRITFDKHISSSVGTLDMFSEEFEVCGVLKPQIAVLEVKFDDYLPDTIFRVLKTAMADQCAISKYVMCRKEKRRILFR